MALTERVRRWHKGYTMGDKSVRDEVLSQGRLGMAALREISVAAGCDPRSVSKWLQGETLRPLVAERIQRAVAELVERKRRGA